MAVPFVYTNPEAARQAIADRQLQAALAENASREAIAHEQAQQARYATQSQMAEREKDRQVSREDIQARYGANSRATTDAGARERAKLQLDTLTDRIRNNLADPPTKNELEAWFTKTPDLNDDQRNAVRSLRDDAYKVAKANAANGERLAKNYTSELAGLSKAKFPDVKAQAALTKQLRSDKDVLFDASTGTITSRWKMPREDGSASSTGMGADYKPGGVFPSASEMQAAGKKTAVTGEATTIGDMYNRVRPPVVEQPAVATQIPLSPGELYGPPNRATVPSASELAVPQNYDEYNNLHEFYGPPFNRPQSVTPPQYQAIPARNVFGLRSSPIAPPALEAPSFADMSDPYRRAPTAYELYGPPNRVNRVTTIAPPPLYGPPFNIYSDPSLPRISDMQQYGSPNNLRSYDLMMPDYSPPPPYYQ